jgi:hypothetical protein
MTMLRLITALLLCASTLGACANPSSATTVPADSPYQLIIQFRTPVDDPATPAFVQQLSVDAGTALQFVRTLATGAQLYSVDGSLDRTEFTAVVQRLRRRHDVLYVEEDRRVQPAIRK